MLKVVFHGRGGQGAKTAVNLIAETAIISGKYVLAFPEYGPERTGAPMRAFLKIDDKKIRSYEPVINADIAVVIDDSLFDYVDIFGSIKKNGILIVNSDSPDKIKKYAKKNMFSGQIWVVDATSIALRNIGQNKPNLPMVGALLRVNSLVPLRNLVQIIRNYFEFKIGKEMTEKNIAGIQEAFMAVNKIQ